MRRKKDSHRQQGPLHGAHPLYGALSQRGLLDPIKPACNQSQLDGRLRLTSSAFNQLWISMPAVLIRVATVILLHPISTSCITARHLLEFMVQGKITEADIQSTWTPPLPPSSHHFYAKHLFCHNPPNLSWLETGIKQC